MEQVNRLYTIAFNSNEDQLNEEFIDELEYLKLNFITRQVEKKR